MKLRLLSKRLKTIKKLVDNQNTSGGKSNLPGNPLYCPNSKCKKV